MTWSKRLIAGVSATATVAGVGVVGTTALATSADAAGRPTAKVCVINSGGGHFSGTISLNATTGGLFNGRRTVFTHPTGANGCTVFFGLKPGTRYFVSGVQTVESCQTGRMSNGETFTFGNQKAWTFSSRIRRAPKSGQVDFGRQITRLESNSCA